MNRIALLLSVLWFCACPPVPPTPRPPPPDAADATVAPPAPVDAASPHDATPTPAEASVCHSPCDCACRVLARFDCTESKPTPNGETCEQVCVDTTKIPGVSLPTYCVMAAATLAKVRQCGVRCGAP